MRGAWDTSRDGRVTFNEAYQFAFNEILAETVKTVTGVLLGKNFSLIFNNAFSIGIGGYGKANFVGNGPGLPGYGGVFFTYTFSPQKKTHFRATALAGRALQVTATFSIYSSPEST